MKTKIIFLLFFYLFLFNTQIFSKENEITIKEIRIKGNSYTQEKVILHFCNFKIGDKLSKQKLEKEIKNTQEKLSSTFYFFDVSVFLLPTFESDKVVILIEVEEGFLWRFGGGPIYASIGLDNLCGQAKNIDCKLGLNIQSIHYKDLRLFNTRFLTDIFISHTIGEKYELANTKENFEIEKHSQKFSLGYNYKLDLELYIKLLFEQLKFTEFTDKQIFSFDKKTLGIDSNKNIISICPMIKWDTRNSEDCPISGNLFLLNSKISNNILGSNFNFEKISLSNWKYFSFSKNKSFKIKSLLGSSYGNIPYFQLFDIEGINGIRSPKLLSIPNNNLFLLTLEYKQKLLSLPIFGFGEWIDGILFIDIGKTMDKNKQILFKNLDYACGFGFHFHFSMPIGLNIRLEYGINKNGGKFYFSIE